MAMRLLHGPSDYDPIRERISVLRPVRSSALDRRLSDLVLCVLGKFREFTHFPAGLEQWLETWQVQGQLADGNIVAGEAGVFDQVLIVFPRGFQVERAVGEHRHRVMRGQPLDERPKSELLDGTGKDEPAPRLEHASDLGAHNVRTCEMMDHEIDENDVE